MNNLKIFIILAMIFTTVLICVIKPKMHKRVLIGTSDLALIQEENYERDLSTPPKTTQTPRTAQSQPQQGQPKKTNVTAEKVSQQTSNPIKSYKPVQSYTKGKLADQDAFNPQGSHFFDKNYSQQIGTPPPQKLNKTPQMKPNQKHQLTPEEEEIIAWNKWRSDLENQVLKDTEISAPIGTIFRFSFTVDREGNISNLKTWSDNAQYTPMAVSNVKPVILSYQGKRILNFPPKSKRISTNVEGYFMTWTSTGYSTPSDFSDYERVK